MSTGQTGDAAYEDASGLRQRAEDGVRSEQHPGDDEQSALGMEHLVHELRVHQVELEMQNEELQRSRVEVQATADEARLAAARYTELYDFAPIGYVSLSRDGTILESNLAAARMLGTERSQLREARLAVFIADDDLNVFDTFLTEVFSGNTTTGCDVALADHGQSTKFVELNGSADGPSARVVLVDHTERMQARAERDALQAQLRTAQKLEAIGTLVGGIAHDLNNVLAAIYGYTDLVRNVTSHIPSAVDALDGLTVASKRAASLVRQIMVLGHTDERRRETTDLVNIVEEVLDMVQTTAPPQIVFELTNNTTAPSISADPAQIHEIVMNLVVNAIHAIGAAHGRVTLMLDDCTVDHDHPVSSLTPGTYLQLRVTDSGHGMDPRTLDRIFEPFYTTKPQGEGTGLGLWVVHRILKSHGGAVTVDSQPGRGSSFTTYLPAATAETPARPPVATEQRRGSGQLILLVDDEPALCTTGTAALHHLGYEVEAHTRPTEALAAVRARPTAYAVAIVDLTMPELTGLELAEQLHHVAPALPIILTSGNPGGLTIGRPQQHGVRQFLIKPATLTELADATHLALHPGLIKPSD